MFVFEKNIMSLCLGIVFLCSTLELRYFLSFDNEIPVSRVAKTNIVHFEVRVNANNRPRFDLKIVVIAT